MLFKCLKCSFFVLMIMMAKCLKPRGIIEMDPKEIFILTNNNIRNLIMQRGRKEMIL